jgi:hypothetical protein
MFPSAVIAHGRAVGAPAVAVHAGNDDPAG